MKHIFFILATTAMVACSSGRKTGCGDWRDVNRHDRKPFLVQYWTKERSDGYWLITTVWSNKEQVVLASPCKPNCETIKRINEDGYSRAIAIK